MKHEVNVNVCSIGKEGQEVVKEAKCKWWQRAGRCDGVFSKDQIIICMYILIFSCVCTFLFVIRSFYIPIVSHFTWRCQKPVGWISLKYSLYKWNDSVCLYKHRVTDRRIEHWHKLKVVVYVRKWCVPLTADVVVIKATVSRWTCMFLKCAPVHTISFWRVCDTSSGYTVLIAAHRELWRRATLSAVSCAKLCVHFN